MLAHEYAAGETVNVQQRKNLWLLVGGGVLIVVVAGVVGNPVLLLLGGVGALASRLFALLRSDSLAAEFRFTWTANTLGPMYAVAAYGGILAIVVLRDLELLGVVTWESPPTATVLGLAFLLGFSERLVERVADAPRGLIPAANTCGDTSAGGTTTPAQPLDGTLLAPAAELDDWGRTLDDDRAEK